jgi:uncharacterized protein YdhG (YjbR/CyaY superfamily)
MSDTSKSTGKRTTAKKKAGVGFSAEEHAAMKEHGKELQAAARRGKSTKEDGEADVVAKIAEMVDSDRAMAERIHAVVKEAAPELEPKTWYGMPAYAKKGKLVCFFQPAAKFKSRYATFGFESGANLDEGNLWPTAYALTKLTAKEEAEIAALVKKAAG